MSLVKAGTISQKGLLALFESQRDAFLAAGKEGWPQRKDRLIRLRRLVSDNAMHLAHAVSEDFHGKALEEVFLAEISQILSEIDLMLSMGCRWSRARRVPTPWTFFPARSFLCPAPRGLVGVIGAWNYPLAVSLTPAVDALAAGNRVLIKLPERSPETSALLSELIEKSFDAAELAAVVGGPEVAQEFSRLPFNLLVYTGGGAVGQAVMREASENLTPVLLELGGKSQCLVAPGADLSHAARRILVGKLLNAGQTCIAPDVVHVHRISLESFLQALKTQAEELCPDVRSLSALIDIRQARRIAGLVKQAVELGTRCEQIVPASPCDILRPSLFALIDPPSESRIAQEEIFGPALVLSLYTDIEEKITQLRALEQTPLALYWFDKDQRRIERVCQTVPCGGITVNDTLLHYAQNRLPFGGFGSSGMGAYHGKIGFEAMSRMTPVFNQSAFSGFGLLDPPYSKTAKQVLNFFVRKK